MNRSISSTEDGCNIVSVGKRRDGGTKFWCLEHKADATAKYGRKAKKCRYSGIPPLKNEDIINLKVDDYPGGLALWGAVPAIYDTTQRPLDKGVHVHARKKGDESKDIDQTFRKVQIIHKDGKLDISELDAIYYMVSSIFGFEVKLVCCAHCGTPHLDKDWFSIHPHQSHLCAGCGRKFRDDEISVGNPVAAIQKLPFAKKPKTRRSKKVLKIKQKDYTGGIQIWGSNPSILWTSDRHQESGIHVHAFKGGKDKPEIDNTYKCVEIDGVKLDEEQVRIYMAQKTLPHITERIRPIVCSNCRMPSFDKGEGAYELRTERYCDKCRSLLNAGGKLRKVIANPIILTLEMLTQHSIRPPRIHDLGLLPETL